MPNNISLDTREQRKKLAMRDAPYYVDVAKGVAVGYRKGVNGATWSVRVFNGRKYHKRQIGPADDAAPADGISVFSWKDVLKVAIAEPAKADAFTSKYSVKECFEDYFASRRARSRSTEAVMLDEGKVKPFVEQFGNQQVSALTTSALRTWFNGLVIHPDADEMLTEAQRRGRLRASQASANRVLTPVRAALNHAFINGRVNTDVEWRRVKKFKDVDEARKRFLSVAEAGKLLGASKGAFRDLVHAALLTGLRPGELLRLTVGQFQNTRIEVSAGKTGKSRNVAVTTQGVALFKRLAKGRAASDLMLPNPRGTAWTRMQIARSMREAVKAAKLDTDTVFYDLRRSYGSLLANAQANDATIAHSLGHADTRMVRRHYGHLLDSVVAAELEAKLPKFTPRAPRKAAA